MLLEFATMGFHFHTIEIVHENDEALAGFAFLTIGIISGAVWANEAWGSDSDFSQAYLSTRWNVPLGGRFKFLFRAEVEETLGEKFLKPEYIRWEKHRVWVVEANLKEGERHIYQRRVFYIDEDSWTALASEAYDVSGELWRVGYSYVSPLYDVPAVALTTQGHYDLLTGTYYIGGLGGNYNGILTDVEQKPARYFTAQGLSRSGIR